MAWDPFEVEEDPVEEQRKWIERLNQQKNEQPCTLNQPIWMVIPPEGIIIPCPAHPRGHFLRPQSLTYTYNTTCQQT